jgi:hypothetical protein
VFLECYAPNELALSRFCLLSFGSFKLHFKNDKVANFAEHFTLLFFAQRRVQRS